MLAWLFRCFRGKRPFSPDHSPACRQPSQPKALKNQEIQRPDAEQWPNNKPRRGLRTRRLRLRSACWWRPGAARKHSGRSEPAVDERLSQLGEVRQDARRRHQGFEGEVRQRVDLDDSSIVERMHAKTRFAQTHARRPGVSGGGGEASTPATATQPTESAAEVCHLVERPPYCGYLLGHAWCSDLQQVHHPFFNAR